MASSSFQTSCCSGSTFFSSCFSPSFSSFSLPFLPWSLLSGFMLRFFFLRADSLGDRLSFPQFGQGGLGGKPGLFEVQPLDCVYMIEEFVTEVAIKPLETLRFPRHLSRKSHSVHFGVQDPAELESELLNPQSREKDREVVRVRPVEAPIKQFDGA